MEQWVENPQAETALSNILPCVDRRTTTQTLVTSNQVVTDIVNVVNKFINTHANSNAVSRRNLDYHYYNQSGPPMPRLCYYPFDSRLHDRQCVSGEVSTANASLVWRNYICPTSGSGFCEDVGRLTPNMYRQLVTAVNICYALEHYVPPLLSFQDCTFVRNTIDSITSDFCPSLEMYLRMGNVGLVLISAGVMLSLALWIVHANCPRREEAFAKLLKRIRMASTLR